MGMRTFLALDLDEPIRRNLAEAQAALDVPGGKINWTAADKLHVTLNFLGDVADEKIHSVCEIAQAVAEGIEIFEFHVRAVKVVPPHGPVRMLWANVEDPSGRLVTLQNELALALAGLGLREEARLYRPHITMARVKFLKDANLLRTRARQYADFDFGAQHAEEVVAYTSQLTAEGSLYTPLCRASLE